MNSGVLDQVNKEVVDVIVIASLLTDVIVMISLLIYGIGKMARNARIYFQEFGEKTKSSIEFKFGFSDKVNEEVDCADDYSFDECIEAKEGVDLQNNNSSVSLQAFLILYAILIILRNLLLITFLL